MHTHVLNSLVRNGHSRRIEMRIEFRTKREDAEIIRGEENVAYDFNRDGLITFHASSRSRSPEVSRDVIYTLSPDYRPLEAFVRMQVEGSYGGAGWFRFRDGIASSTSQAPDGTETTNRLVLHQDVRAFCSHPVSTDALMVAAYDHKVRSRRQSPGNVFVSSTDPFGRSTPTLVKSSIAIEYVNLERLSTCAGSIETDHYRFYESQDKAEPVQEMWVLAGTCIFLKSRAAGVYDTSYQLVDLRAD